jgi:Ca2+-binding RTX toxin-like protein
VKIPSNWNKAGTLGGATLYYEKSKENKNEFNMHIVLTKGDDYAKVDTASVGVHLNINGKELYTGGEGGSVAGVDNIFIYGEEGDDKIVIDTKYRHSKSIGVHASGGDGDDHLNVRAGDANARGDAGSDLVKGSGDKTFLVGGAGDDRIVDSASQVGVVATGAGSDKVIAGQNTHVTDASDKDQIFAKAD